MHLSRKLLLVAVAAALVPAAPSALAQQAPKVDLNSIPIAAIERIEVLKDGASAIYGSDAIAGVVNVILRKDYRGIEATVGGGITDVADYFDRGHVYANVNYRFR